LQEPVDRINRVLFFEKSRFFDVFNEKENGFECNATMFGSFLKFDTG
jgi:hypothetical protein